MAKKQSPSTLLWFIRRKSYIPICEIRRRFEVDTEEGSSFLDDHGLPIYVGLPANTCGAVEKLWRQGKIGLELSVEFDCQVLIGVWPMVPAREPAVVLPRRQSTLRIVENIVESEGPAALAAGE